MIALALVATALNRRLGKALSVMPMEQSSTGAVFLAQSKTDKWVVKVFPKEEAHVAARTIEILRVLQRRGTITPKLIVKDLLPVGSHVGYVYEYIHGPCLRDLCQSTELNRDVSSLVTSVCSLFRDAWDAREWRSGLFDHFDLLASLSKSVALLTVTEPGIALVAERRLERVPLRHLPSASTPVHADLHSGNVVASHSGLVAIDFDSVCLSVPEKAFAALIGKVYEEASPHSGRYERVGAIIGTASALGVTLEPRLLRLFVLQKKLGEILYLDHLRASRVVDKVWARYRVAAITGARNLLSEWDRFATPDP